MQLQRYSYSSFFYLISLSTFSIIECDSQDSDTSKGILDLSSVNHKVVGLMLKSNGRRYYISSELCPGGIFLTKPIDEHCLCYNGIFQVIRQCCDAESTRINAEQLEWKMDFKCGLSSGEHERVQPIRAILPVTKAYNRLGSVIMAHSTSGKNISQWRKFDAEDVIIRNEGELRMKGKKIFEIINLRPLGREIKIWFGKNADVAVCFSGWLVNSPYNLRIRLSTKWNRDPEEVETKDCCFKVEQANTPGQVEADCTSAVITTELIEIPSTDIDIGQCHEDFPEEALHKIKKRQQSKLHAYPILLSESSKREDLDVLGDEGRVVIKREADFEDTDLSPFLRFTRQGKLDSTVQAILPRKMGIANAHLSSQHRAINEFIAVIRNDRNAEIEPPKTYRFQLLKKSFDILLAVISNDIVPHIMLKSAYDIFYFLYEGIESITYDPPDIHQRAMGYLDKCLKNSKPINFTTFGCPRQIDAVVVTPEIKKMLESDYSNNPDELQRKFEDLKNLEIRQNKRFIPELHDIYVDINWKVVDFVHSFCFEYFKEEFNAHHFYETELERIFLYPEVQIRWLHVKRPRNEKFKYVNGIFPTVTNLELSMKHLDKVTATGHLLSRYNGTFWLNRPNLDANIINLKLRNLGNRPPVPQRASSLINDARKIFTQDILEESQKELLGDNNIRKMGLLGQKMGEQQQQSSTSDEREVTYPFKVLDKLPAGELIWDGRAVCLHASYSDKKGYFENPDTWGVSPSLIELGKLYPVEE